MLIKREKKKRRKKDENGENRDKKNKCSEKIGDNNKLDKKIK